MKRPDDGEAEQRRFQRFTDGPSHHYVDVLAQLKRNVEIKRAILAAEQNACEVAFSAVGPEGATHAVQQVKARLAVDYAQCAAQHSDVLLQRFPTSLTFPGDVAAFIDGSAPDAAAAVDSRRRELDEQRRTAEARAVFDSARREIDVLERAIAGVDCSSSSSAVVGDAVASAERAMARLQELAKQRFERVYKMLNDVTLVFAQSVEAK